MFCPEVLPYGIWSFWEAINGELSEWSKVQHSKCCRPTRPLGFESLTLRHIVAASVISLAATFCKKVTVRSFCCGSSPQKVFRLFGGPVIVNPMGLLDFSFAAGRTVSGFTSEHLPCLLFHRFFLFFREQLSPLAGEIARLRQRHSVYHCLRRREL